MKETIQFLKEAGVFFVATVNGNKPGLRPFGVVCEFEGKLYISTNNQKECFKQMLANPNIVISAMAGNKWIRLECEAIHEDNREARKYILDTGPGARAMYNEDDGLFEVLYLQNATATIYGGAEPEVHTF